MPRSIANYMDQARQHEVCRGIQPGELETLTWRAIVDITTENDLPFMVGEGRVQTEAAYRTGTVAVAGTALTLTGGTWQHSTWTGRRIRISGRNETYEIASFSSATTATLATAWQGDVGAGLAYEMFRDVYTFPNDCDYAKALVLWDVVGNREVFFMDYPAFRKRKREALAATGDPDEVAVLGITAAGLVQVEFGPLAPSSARTYLLDYYRKPTKPTALTDALSPAWPEQFTDIIPKRVVWEYALRKGHPRRLEMERAYRTRIFQMAAQLDGGNEVLRRLRPTGGTRGSVASGVRVGARWTGA